MENIKLKPVDFLGLFISILLGCGLRFWQLTAKPPWTDEFATMVFSLGNSFDAVPLNQVISLESLLHPLKFNPEATVNDVISLLLHEDNHPPLYFILNYWWLRLFSDHQGYISLWLARALPAFFGVLSIPALYFLARVTFNSRLVAQLAAALMAISPYGVFIAQEARHYTLAILFIIISLSCLIIAVKSINQQKNIPLGLIFFWMIINSLGLNTHYFFAIALGAEALSLLLFLCKFNPFSIQFLSRQNTIRLMMVIGGSLGTVLGLALVVIPLDYGNGMTAWIQQKSTNLIAFVSPVFQLLAAAITMFSLLPVESSLLPVIVLSGLIMLVYFIWLTPQIKRGLSLAWRHLNYPLGLKLILGYLISAIALFFLITYGLGMDITRGARYHFVYFPSLLILLAIILGVLIEKSSSPILFKKSIYNQTFSLNKNHVTLGIVGLMGLVSSLTVCLNLGYQKYYRPDQFVEIINHDSSPPILIVYPHKNLVQTGEMMGIGWEITKSPLSEKVNFLLLHQEGNNPSLDSEMDSEMIENSLKSMDPPREIWAVNFQHPIKLNNYVLNEQSLPPVDGYDYSFFKTGLTQRHHL